MTTGSSSWNTVRIFISSTFRDMQAERDHLVKVVFPALRERLAPYRVNLTEIDLRWGVTRQQAENNQALELCLRQIDACRPYFLGILGERYGWTPTSFPAAALQQYGWVSDHAGKSITEIEVLHGALRDPERRQRCFFYFRDPSPLARLAEVHRKHFIDAPLDEDVRSLGLEEATRRVESRRASLLDLKRRIRDSGLSCLPDYPWSFAGYRVRPSLARVALPAADAEALARIVGNSLIDPDEYERLAEHPHLQRFVQEQGALALGGLEAFGEQVFHDLWNALATDPRLELSRRASGAAVERPAADGELSLAEERDHHERFLESRLQVYARRRDVERRILDFCRGPATCPLLLVGESGSGKSAILSRASSTVRRLLAGKQRSLVVSHFVGASPRSSSLRDVLRRFCLELQATFGIGDRLPASTPELAGAFQTMLTTLPATARVLFVIDGLDQLDDTDGAHQLRWLPLRLPAGVKVVASCADDVGAQGQGAVLKAFQLRDHERLRLRDYPLSEDDRRWIIATVPSLAAKTLEPEHVRSLLDLPATANPLYLSVALEELRGFGSFELLHDRIRLFHQAESPAELFGQVVRWLADDSENGVVEMVLGAIAVSRSGMREAELQEFVGGTREAARREVATVLRQMRPYLLRRDDVVDFYHRSLDQAVQTAFLRDGLGQSLHQRLADYFEGKGRGGAGETWDACYPRGLSETAFHRRACADWDGLARLLEDDRYRQLKLRAGMARELAEEFGAALALAPLDLASRLLDLLFARASADWQFEPVLIGALSALAAQAPARSGLLSERQVPRSSRLAGALLLASRSLIAEGHQPFANAVLELAGRASGEGGARDPGILHNRAVALASAGNYAEGFQVAQEALTIARERNDRIQEPIVLATLASICSDWSKYEDAEKHARETIDTARGTVMERILPRAHLFLVESLTARRRYDEVEELVRAGQALARRYDYNEEYVRLGAIVGQMYLDQGRGAEAVVAYQELLQVPAETYAATTRAVVIYRLAYFLHQSGRSAEALRVLEENLARAEMNLPANYELLGEIRLQLGDLPGAWQATEQGLECGANRENVRTDIDRLFSLQVRLCEEERNYKKLREVLARAEPHVRETAARGLGRRREFGPVVLRMGQAYCLLAMLEKQRGNRVAERDLLRTCLSLCIDCEPTNAALPISCGFLAEVSMALGNREEARELRDRGLATIANLHGTHLEQVTGYLYYQFSLVHRANGDLDGEHALLCQAREHLDRPGFKGRLVEVLIRLATVEEARGDRAAADGVRVRLQELCAAGTVAERLELARMLLSCAEPHGDPTARAQSLALAGQAVQILREVRGPDHPDVAAALKTLAAVHQAFGEAAEAATATAQAEAIQARADSASHADPALALYNQGQAHFDRQEWQPARERWQQALEVRQRQVGPDHPDLLPVLTSLAKLETQLGHTREAIACYERLVTLTERDLGKYGVQFSQAVHPLAGLYDQQKNHEAAAKLYQRFLAFQQKHPGISPADRARTQAMLALNQQRLGQHAEALANMAQAVEVLAGARGPEDRETLVLMEWLGTVNRDCRNYRDALTWFERLLARQEGQSRPALDAVAKTLTAIARLHHQQARTAEAIAHAERALETYRRAHGGDHPDCLPALGVLVDCYTAQRNPEKVYQLRCRCLALCEQPAAAGHPDRFDAVNKLAVGFTNPLKVPELIRAWTCLLAFVEQTHGPEHPDVLTACEVLGSLYLGTNCHDKALPLLQRKLALRQRLAPDQEQKLMTDREHLAGCYFALDQSPDAIPLFQEVLEYKLRHGAEHTEVLKTVWTLAGLCRKHGRFAEALGYYQQAVSLREAQLGPEGLQVVPYLGPLADFHEERGQPALALPVRLRVVRILDAHGPQNHVEEWLKALQSLASLYLKLNEKEAALETLERLTTFAAGLSSFGPDALAELWKSLGSLSLSINNHARAIPFFEKALACQERHLGTDHPELRSVLTHLVLCHATVGNQEALLRALRRLVPLLDPTDPTTPQFRQALEEAEARSGPGG